MERIGMIAYPAISQVLRTCSLLGTGSENLRQRALVSIGTSVPVLASLQCCQCGGVESSRA